jgi:origin recognition complex subunit 1
MYLMPRSVVLLDEIDQLVTRNQLVLYNLFDWPRRAHSKLIVIGIANTMDLPERLLPKVHSRLGLQRVSFAAYSSAQLEQIARQRLGPYATLFDTAALQLVARKVAATTADARRALEVMRRALLLAEREAEARAHNTAAASTGPVLVTARVVDAALGALLARAKCPALRSAPRHGRLLVATVARLSGTVTVSEVLERYAALCLKWQVAPLGPSQLRAVLYSLAACRLITCEHDRVLLCIERVRE